MRQRVMPSFDLDEMLDEWGREFFASRRRIDLIRYGKFSSGPWWDKTTRCRQTYRDLAYHA